MSVIRARFQKDWPGFSLAADLALPSRGVTALFGPSGSGKTTLLRCMAGLEVDPNGYFCFNNEVWQDGRTWLPTHKRPLGYVFQEASLFSHLSVLDNLRYGQRRMSGTAQIDLQQAIDLLGIKPLLARHTSSLSGGEKQRVAIARALAVSPKILLMDEPLAALDLARKQEVLPYLERLHDELDIPIIYVSHSADEVARLADHLVVMDQGTVVASGPLQETLARVDLPIRLGEDVAVVLHTVVAERDTQWHLARLDFAGGHVWVPDSSAAIGHTVRVRVLARDITLTTDLPEQQSALNSLLGQVDMIMPDVHPGLLLVRVLVGPTAFIARITKRSAAALAVEPKSRVWLQIKSVALAN
ncbi:MAG: molybdenum ABC transporter ATP-binding protein [Moraxellaceae bacterium]|nr:molybdenum ABC transporter ATP-binding protein [Moraxellaceae bacterium]MDZ4386228.1 molybdenum ABC transporter ATP-binding protein [Moraxellaceae bacterium]